MGFLSRRPAILEGILTIKIDVKYREIWLVILDDIISFNENISKISVAKEM